jgi:hypothetical protein
MQKLVGISIALVTATLGWLLTPAQAVAPSATSVVIGQRSPDTQSAPVPVTTTVVERLPDGVPADLSKRCPQYEQMLAAHGLYPVQAFSYIAWRESGCRPRAVNARWDSAGNIVWTLNRNGSYDSGLLQINSSWKTVTRETCGGGIDLLMTLDCNMRVAKYLLDNGGLGHWSL